MKFLIVDDSRAIQTIVRRAVQSAGFADCEFQSASNGMEALRILDDGPVDLVITDWHMPGMSGLELLRRLRARHARLKVGFVTTESAQASIDEATQLGALFFVGKPFTDDELARRLREGIGLPVPDSAGAAPPPAAEEPRVTVAGLAQVASLLGALPGKRVTVSPLTPESTEALRFPSVVGLYALDSSALIRGLCLVDFKAVALLGSDAGDSPREIVRAMAAQELPTPTLDRASAILARHVPRLFTSSDARNLRLTRTQLLKRQIPQLGEIMKRSPCRTDFTIARDDLPVGQLTLVSK